MSSDVAVPAIARPAATVMLVRDGAAGIEIFMVKRARMGALASGETVFPGGKVDADDATTETGRGTSLTGPSPEFWVAAVRETFEEAGVLIAGAADGGIVLDGAAAQKVVAAHRDALNGGAITFSQIMSRERLAPAFDQMVYFANWVSPDTLAKRFDAHFFLVRMPDGQVAVPDGGEAVEGYWVRPADLVRDAVEGKLFLVPATRLNLELLSESDSVDAAMAAAARRNVRPVMPRLVKDGARLKAVIPADAGYRTTEVEIVRP